MLARTGMLSRAQATFTLPVGASLGSLTMLKIGLRGGIWEYQLFTRVLAKVGRFV